MNTAKTVQMNIRLPRELSKELDSLAKLTRIKRISLVRRALENGIMAERRTLALQLYKESEVTLSRAAEIAGVSIWEMDDLISAAELRSPMSVADAISEVRRIVAAAQRES